MSSLTIRLPAEIDKRLNQLAKKTHRTKTFYAREALLNYLEELEDTYIALQRLEEPGKNYSMAEVAKEIGFSKKDMQEVGFTDKEIKEIGLENRVEAKRTKRPKKTR